MMIIINGRAATTAWQYSGIPAYQLLAAMAWLLLSSCSYSISTFPPSIKKKSVC